MSHIEFRPPHIPLACTGWPEGEEGGFHDATTALWVEGAWDGSACCDDESHAAKAIEGVMAPGGEANWGDS